MRRFGWTLALLAAGCWETFTPPAGDDDDVVLSDDDTADDDTADDDDADDDDTADDDTADDDSGDDDASDDDSATDPDGDDDSTPDCGGPSLIETTLELFDPLGQPTTNFAPAAPLTIRLSLQNIGGGSASYQYVSACLGRWDLWYPNGDPVGGGPSCLVAITTVTLDCGAPPVTWEATVPAQEQLSGNPLPPGSYRLDLNTYHFGVLQRTVTVP